MLRALVKKQWLQMIDFMFKGNKKKRSGVMSFFLVILSIFVLISFGSIFYMISNELCGPLTDAGYEWLYFSVMAVIATVISVFINIFTVYSNLYVSGDNEFLLSMPIPPSKILLVRVASVYFSSFVAIATVIVPTYISDFGYSEASGAKIAFGIIILLFLPLFSLSISCVLGWIFSLLMSRLGKSQKNIIRIVLSLLFIGAYYVVYSSATHLIEKLLEYSTQVADKIHVLAFPVYAMGHGAVGEVLPIIAFTLISIALFAVIYVILSSSFIKIATRNNGSSSATHKIKNVDAKTLEGALLSKELKRFFGNSLYMLNAGLGSVFLPVLGILAIVKRDYFANISSITSLNILPFGICIIICCICSMNAVTASSISLEGRNLWILKSLPIDAWKILKSKAKLCMIITGPSALFCAVCADIMLETDIATSVLIPLVVLAFVLFCSFFGLFTNLKMPKLDWISEVTVIKQSMSVFFTIFGGGLFALILFVPGVFATRNALSTWQYLIFVLVILLAIDYILFRWLKKRGVEIFENL